MNIGDRFLFLVLLKNNFFFFFLIQLILNENKFHQDINKMFINISNQINLINTTDRKRLHVYPKANDHERALLIFRY
jgi:hypothetical protein